MRNGHRCSCGNLYAKEHARPVSIDTTPKTKKSQNQTICMPVTYQLPLNQPRFSLQQLENTEDRRKNEDLRTCSAELLARTQTTRRAGLRRSSSWFTLWPESWTSSNYKHGGTCTGIQLHTATNEYCSPSNIQIHPRVSLSEMLSRLVVVFTRSRRSEPKKKTIVDHVWKARFGAGFLMYFTSCIVFRTSVRY